jgi:hypothetical protein
MATSKVTGDARPEPRVNRRRRAARIAVVLFVLCLIYILSIGPFVALIVATGTWDNPHVGTFATVFYAPLYYVSYWTHLKGPLKLYAYWWAELGDSFHSPPQTVHNRRSYSENFPTDP